MKKIYVLFCLLFLSLTAFGQSFTGDDQYPETDPALASDGEFSPRGLPDSDYEDVPREEQEYRAPDAPVPVTEDMISPEEAYEANEEYLE